MFIPYRVLSMVTTLLGVTAVLATMGSAVGELAIMENERASESPEGVLHTLVPTAYPEACKTEFVVAKRDLGQGVKDARDPRQGVPRAPSRSIVVLPPRLRVVASVVVCVVVSTGAALAQSPVAVERAKRAIEALKSDLAVVDVGGLDEADRKRYSEALWLRTEAFRVMKDEGSNRDLDIATMLERAESLLAPLVSRALRLDGYLALLERYRATGSTPSGSDAAALTHARLLPLIRYVEQNPGRLGVPGSSLEKLTPAAVTAAVVFNTDLGFGAADGGSLLLATVGFLQVLDDARLPSGFRKTWYLAVAAHLQGELDLLHALEHADRSVARFPQDPEVLVAVGALDEMLASRHVTLSTDMLWIGVVRKGDVARHMATLNRRRRDGLKLAEAAYRKALAIDPQSAESRLRLGRVLSLTRRGEAALAELEAASAASSADTRTRYLAALFAGGVHEAAGRWPLAIEAYRLATQQGPFLSAGIALSHALQAAGDRDAAHEALQRSLDRDRQEQRSDPWWDYPLGPRRLRDRLLHQLREAIR